MTCNVPPVSGSKNLLHRIVNEPYESKWLKPTERMTLWLL